MKIEELYKIYLDHPDITTDTRKVYPGQLFFALKGHNFNGNKFALKAIELGAAYAIVDEDIDPGNIKIIRTESVLITLQQLAKYHREKFKIPFIAITGSNGKTTTKELVTQVLSSTFRTFSTYGNLNNHIGVPLTILKIPLEAEMAVIEMGANHQLEIASYCEYAMPSHGLITNCGKAHLEGFGGVEGVIKGKGELFQYLDKHEGFAFVNNNDPAIKNLSATLKNTFTYGDGGNINGNAEVYDSFLKVSITVGVNIIVHTKLVGTYNLPNVLAAVAVGKYFNVSESDIKTAIESYVPSNSRSQLIEDGGLQIILDAYNANPSSMKVAIENFAAFKNEKKILLLGSMMELGIETEKEHKRIIDIIDQFKWEAVVLVGESFKKLPHKYISFDNVHQARDWYKEKKYNEGSILIKGSRSMGMEKVLE